MRTFAAALAMFAALAPLAAGQGDFQRLLLRGARVLSPDGEGWLDGRVVVVEGGRIAAVAAPGEVELDGAELVDLEGLYLVPGLIDLHTHLVLYPYDQRSWNDQVLMESHELRAIRAAAAARETLRAGWTTVRDLGTEGAGWADVGLRDAIALRLVEGPRILAATRAIVATGCYGPSGFAPQWELPVGAQVADGADGVRVAVREQVAAGADWIKVYADYRRRPGDSATPSFSLEELLAITGEAASAGVPVAAHATTDEAIRRAVEAGVRTIEHGTGASVAALAEMRRRDVVLCPTLAAAEAIARYGGWGAGEPEPPRLAEARALVARAREAGVQIACGSDAGVFAYGDNARELELLVECGLTPAEALRGATTLAARTIERSGELGRIEVGWVADLVAVEGNPLADVSALRAVRLVVRDGRVAFDRRGERGAEARAAAAAVAEQLLFALAARDAATCAALLAPEVAVAIDRGGPAPPEIATGAELLERVASGIGAPPYRQWIAGRPEVALDGALATVRAEILTEAAGERRGGVAVLGLARGGGGWRIVSLALSTRNL